MLRRSHTFRSSAAYRNYQDPLFCFSRLTLPLCCRGKTRNPIDFAELRELPILVLLFQSHHVVCLRIAQLQCCVKILLILRAYQRLPNWTYFPIYLFGEIPFPIMFHPLLHDCLCLLSHFSEIWVVSGSPRQQFSKSFTREAGCSPAGVPVRTPWYTFPRFVNGFACINKLVM